MKKMRAKFNVRPKSVATIAHIPVNLTFNQQHYAEIRTDFCPDRSRNTESAGRNPFAPLNEA